MLSCCILIVLESYIYNFTIYNIVYHIGIEKRVNKSNKWLTIKDDYLNKTTSIQSLLSFFSLNKWIE